MRLSALFAWTVFLLIGTAATVSAQTAKRPNFIVIIADDVSWDDLGCYGHPHIRTPNLDRMAKKGTRFTQAFLTTSSCSPSRCSILTGRYPHNTGAGELHQPLPKEQVLLSSLLRQAGYYTASAGKWHLGKAAEAQFDLVTGGGPSGCENWVKVLKDRPRDRPFFLWLAAIDAHRPYPGNAIEQPHTTKDVVVPPFLPDNDETRKDLALYYDEITRLDGFVGQVMAELERQGVADNTVVIFLADNGRPFPRCKTTLYDSGIRTPFLVQWPRQIKAGTVCDGLISSIDMAPTLLKLAGAKQSPTFQGKSFAKMLTDPSARIRDTIFAEHNWHDYQAHERAVRSEKYLYIRNAFPQLPGTPPADAVRSPTYKSMLQLEAQGKLPPEQRGCFVTPRPAEELYDVRADPHCLKNLAGGGAHGEVLQTMRQALDRWIEETKDRVPEKPTPDKFDRTTGVGLGK
jgi:N-sulfoglucosamine sulfohydrolase